MFIFFSCAPVRAPTGNKTSAHEQLLPGQALRAVHHSANHTCRAGSLLSLAELGRTPCWASFLLPSPSVDVSCFSVFCNELFVHFNSFWDKFCPEMFEQGMTAIPEAELLDVIGTKVCMSCPPCYSQTPLITVFTSPSLNQKWFETDL